MSSIGGLARAASLTTSRRHKNASNAAKARWKNATAEQRAAQGNMLAATRAEWRKRVKSETGITKIERSQRQKVGA
jgi:hypothetical protein